MSYVQFIKASCRSFLRSLLAIARGLRFGISKFRNCRKNPLAGAREKPSSSTDPRGEVCAEKAHWPARYRSITMERI